MDSEFDSEDEKPQKKQRKSVQGRSLMRWNPDEDQLLLLTVDHVCVKNGIPIPWDEVAKQIRPFLTGEAVKQHLAKVRHFRELNDRAVPNKLEKGARRKAQLANTTDPTTPAKGGRAKKVKVEDAEDETADMPKKGASLLWTAPPKKTKTLKNGKDADPNTPATARRGGGRKNATVDGGSGESFKNTNASTGKRGRKKQTVKKEDEDDMAAFDSPTKKPKTTSPRQQQDDKTFSLRPKEEIDYNEHIDSDYDIYDAQQEDDEDETYEDMQWSQQDSTVKNAFENSQSSTVVGDVPPLAFMVPGNTGYHTGYPTSASPTYTHPNNGGLFGLAPLGDGNANTGGLPNGFLQQLMHANGVNSSAGPMVPFDGFRGTKGFPPNIISHYGQGAYGLGMPNLNHFNDPRREQDLRDAISKTLSTVPEEVSVNAATTESKQKVKTPRKKATAKVGGGSAASTPKKKTTPNAVTAKGNKAATAGASEGISMVVGKYEPVMKAESQLPSAGDDVFYDSGNTSGTIPIANDTGYGNDVDFGYNANTITSGMELTLNTHVNQVQSAYAPDGFDFNDMDSGVNPSHNVHVHGAPPTPITASPTDIFDPTFGFNHAHTGVTPQISKFTFENFSNYPFNNSSENSQLTQYPSHSSSFESIQPSQSVEAMPGFDQDGTMDFEQGWDQSQYEQQLPGDEFANMGGWVDDDIFN